MKIYFIDGALDSVKSTYYNAHFTIDAKHGPSECLKLFNRWSSRVEVDEIITNCLYLLDYETAWNENLKKLEIYFWDKRTEAYYMVEDIVELNDYEIRHISETYLSGKFNDFFENGIVLKKRLSVNDLSEMDIVLRRDNMVCWVFRNEYTQKMQTYATCMWGQHELVKYNDDLTYPDDPSKDIIAVSKMRSQWKSISLMRDYEIALNSKDESDIKIAFQAFNWQYV